MLNSAPRLTQREENAVRTFVRLGLSLKESYRAAGLALKWVDEEAAKLEESERDLFRLMMEALR